MRAAIGVKDHACDVAAAGCHSRLEGVDGDRPLVRFRHDGRDQELPCDVVAGCDGFHGVCRDAVPAAAWRVFERAYPFAWLGVLAAVAPSSEEIVYAASERGFALHSMRSPKLTRLYLQVAPDEPITSLPVEYVPAPLLR